MIVQAELVKLSICKCGFTLLHDDIKLGTIYRVETTLTYDQAQMQCGGCGKLIKWGKAIYAYHRNGPGGHYLPVKIFKFQTDAKPKPAQKRPRAKA